MSSGGILNSYAVEEFQECIFENVLPSERRSEQDDTGENDGSEVNAVNENTKTKRLSSHERLSRDRESHPLLPASCKCASGCYNDIEGQERAIIHNRFWLLNYNGRKNDICQVVNQNEVKRHRKVVSGERKRGGNYTYCFKFAGIAVPVCQKFFLETLGYNSRQVLKRALKECGKI